VANNPKPFVVVGWGCDLFVVRVGLQREGLGSPAPIDAPINLVVNGL